MQRVILVISPDTEFLQQLRSHLEEGGRYQVTVALSAHEALNLANSNFFEVAIVDGELDDIPVSAFTRDLAALQSDLEILVFPPNNNPQHPVLEGLVTNGFLSKPFSGQEVSKALSRLFSDQPITGNLQVKVVDDLVKQWLQIPETGGRKAEQILETTSAQSVLIIIKDQVIASSGSMDEGLINNVTRFLSRYWKEEENSELARYIKLDGDGSERFLYATKLVCNVVLVMIYPMKATLQVVRRELNNVKDDFQQHYPTTGELRQDIAKQALADINIRNKKLETLQTNTNTISQNELDLLNQHQQQISIPNNRAISQEEIDMLKALNQTPEIQPAAAISQAELDARKLFEQESLKVKPVSDKDVTQSELDALNLLEQSLSQPGGDSVSQAEAEARRLFEQETQKTKPKPILEAISQEEIDLLKALEEEASHSASKTVSQSELDARRLFEQESLKPKPTINAISQEEIDLLKALSEKPSQPTSNTLPQAELEARKLFEQESLKSKPESTIKGISQEEIDQLKALQGEPHDEVTQAELEARKLFEQESLKSKPKPTINGISQDELDALNSPQQGHQKSDTENTPAISEQELANLSQMLDQMPTPDPQSDAETSLEEKKLPEWLNELENTENSAQSSSSSTPPQPSLTESAPTGKPPFVGIDQNLVLTPAPSGIEAAAAQASEPLPEIDFKLPWELEDTTAEPISEQPVETAVKPVLESAAEEQTTPAVQFVAEPPIEALQPAAASFAEVLNTVTPQSDNIQNPLQSAAVTIAPTVSEPIAIEEPTSLPNPPSLKEFRFNYTLVLIPGDHNQFLARNLSEKLSSIMPDIHEDQGWRMTSITIRPQYLLWTVAVPMGICPHRIIQEVRNLTSNSIFANFSEIAKTKTSNDFWSSKFLAVSGSEPPPANLIFDFVSNAWKDPETDTP